MKFTEEDVKLLHESYTRHADNIAWYTTIVAASIAFTSSIKEAIEVAEATYKEYPTPPETSDEEEVEAQKSLAKDLSSLLNQLPEDQEDVA